MSILTIKVHKDEVFLFGYETKRDWHTGSHSYLIRRTGELCWVEYVTFWRAPTPRKLIRKVLAKMRGDAK